MADVLTLVNGKEDNWLIKLRDLVFASLAFPFGVVSTFNNLNKLILFVTECQSVNNLVNITILFNSCTMQP